MWCDAQSKQNVRAQNTGPYRGRQNSKIDFFFVIYCLVFMFLKKLLFRNNKKVKKWYERKLLIFTCSFWYMYDSTLVYQINILDIYP